MITKLVKLVLFVGFVLFLGQVRIAGKTIGDRFVSSLDTSAKWAGKKFNGESILSGFELPKWELPDFIKSWTNKKSAPRPTQASTEEITEDDQEKLLHLLN